MNKPQPKTFNTTGVCITSKHYTLPVLPRIPDIGDMIEGEFYFILHAPRQSGKTTFIQTLTDKINSDGNYYALNCSLASLRSVHDDEKAMNRISDLINKSLKRSSLRALKALAYPDDSIPQSGSAVQVNNFLNFLCVNLDKELAVFFDEADCLTGPALVTLLAQIRDGYLERHLSDATKFPRSMALVGMRDIRDYLVQVRPEEQSTGLASPFNVKKKSLTLADFTLEEIQNLYNQHTDATGQIFDQKAVERAWHWSAGQPWLVNALAYEVVVEQLRNDYSKIISGSNIDCAAQSLITRNDTHFDSLKERLKEPRVRRVIEAVVIGASKFPKGISVDDVQYALDLGLLKKDHCASDVLQPANPIYQEIIVRTLTADISLNIKDKEIDSYSLNRWMDGTNLDMSGLLIAFQDYWAKNSEIYIKANKYDGMILNSVSGAIAKFNISGETPEDLRKEIINNLTEGLINLTNEALTHLVLFAFLQRVLNGGADYLQREYALGALRVDICVGYKGRDYPLEIKIHGSKTREASLEQLFVYMNRIRAAEGWLVVFDKDFSKPWDVKTFWETQDYKDKIIHIVGC